MSRVEFMTGQWTKIAFRSNNMVTGDKNGFLWAVTKHTSKHLDKPNSMATCTGPRNTV